MDRGRVHDVRPVPVLDVPHAGGRDDGRTDPQSETIAALAPEQVNYIRNSVKATVDAYSGEVTLYAWDDDRPGARDVDGNVFPDIDPSR